jgi:hypothetical protein
LNVAVRWMYRPTTLRETRNMRIGDKVRVRATGRLAQIIEDRGQLHYRVLFYPDPAVDALDRATPEDEDDAGGIYAAEDLELTQ